MEQENTLQGQGKPQSTKATGGIWSSIRKGFNWVDDFLKRWISRMLFILIHVVIIAAAAYFFVYFLSKNQCYSSLEKVPTRKCGVVLGTAPKVGIRDNLYFTTRIDAASALYKEEKVHFLIVSGDNARAGYNEPAEMKKALIKAGVPAEKIYCDYAGFSTLDSVVRAQKVFGLDEFTVISQRFHNERAIYIARRHGMTDVVAYDAEMPQVASRWKLYLREVAARIKAIFEVEMFNAEPRFLGPEVRISESSPPVDAPE